MTARPWITAVALALVARGLDAQRRTTPQPRALSDNGTVGLGESVAGRLGRGDVLLSSDSTYAQQWKLAGSAGQVLTIDVVSDAFDAYVLVVGPGFEGRPPQDDDSGGHCNARLTLRLPESGEYRIVVTSSDKFATGLYSLTLTPGSKPKSLARCDR